MRARGAEPLFASAEQDALLDRIAATAVHGSLGVFDLDGCLFDNRPRQIRILRELASRENLPELYRVEAAPLPRLVARATRSRTPESHSTWFRVPRRSGSGASSRASTSATTTRCPGPRLSCGRCYGSGMRVVYLTGRDDSMRPGHRAGAPALRLSVRRRRAFLVTKPRSDEDDVAFKTAALEHLGDVDLYVDNEPANVNVARARHPNALVVFFESDHSDRPDEPHPDIPWLRSFVRTR